MNNKKTQRNSGCDKWQRKKHECDLSVRRFDQAKNDIMFILDYFSCTEQ